MTMTRTRLMYRSLTARPNCLTNCVYMISKWRYRMFMIFFYDVNSRLTEKGLQDWTTRCTSNHVRCSLDMLTASLAKHSRTLTENWYFNGHPDLIVQGVYPRTPGKRETKGIEIATTCKSGGAVDTTALETNGCACSYTTPIRNRNLHRHRRSMTSFTEIYLGKVTTDDFRKIRGELETRTTTLPQDGIKKLERELDW